ncbi:MAG TPA: FUSC family protein [Hyphomicrobiaceae bacterium]|nr:FUSC family protein [Hyphomicrobiaceae bacterium]
MGIRGHLAGALRWSADGVDRPAALAAGLGMAIPVLLGAAMGKLPLGLAASLGALFAAGARTGASGGEQVRGLAELLAAAAVAAVAGILIAGHEGWTDLAIAGLAGLAAVIGGYDYLLAVGSARFIVYLVLSVNFAETGGEHRSALLALLLLGALGASALALILGALFRARGWRTGPALERRPAATAAQKLRRWWRTLKTLAGWQYTLRLVPCLGVAGAAHTLWPRHHLLWIAFTIALLCRRPLERLPLRIVQRAAGTMIGVAASGLLLGSFLPAWGLATLIAVLAGLGPWLRMQNYLVYTATITPLVILLLSGDTAIDPGTLIDRLLATLAGAALVTAANVAMGRWSA